MLIRAIEGDETASQMMISSSLKDLSGKGMNGKSIISQEKQTRQRNSPNILEHHQKKRLNMRTIWISGTINISA